MEERPDNGKRGRERPADRDRAIALVGLMGAGKSAVGRILAARLGRPFADTDALIEAEAGATIAELWAAEGEEAFRARERRWIEDIPKLLSGHVIALGGGMFVGEENVARLRASTWSVWLRARLATLLARLAGDSTGRPLLTGPDPAARLAELEAARAPWYERAHVVLDTDDGEPAEVAAAVERALGGFERRGERERLCPGSG